LHLEFDLGVDSDCLLICDQFLVAKVSQLGKLLRQLVSFSFGHFQALLKISARFFPKVNEFILDPDLVFFSNIQNINLRGKVAQLGLKVTHKNF
jgi:hypothetical protein